MFLLFLLVQLLAGACFEKVLSNFQVIFGFFKHLHDLIQKVRGRLAGVFIDLCDIVFDILIKGFLKAAETSLHDLLDLLIHFLLGGFASTFTFGFVLCVKASKLADCFVKPGLLLACVCRLSLAHQEMIRTCIAEWVACTFEGVGVNLHEGAC